MLLYDPSRLHTLLEECGVDGLLVAKPPNVRYLTRFPKPGGTLGIVLQDSLTEPILIIPSANLDFVLEEVGETAEIHVYGEFFRSLKAGQELDEREERIAHLYHNALENSDRDHSAASILRERGVTTSALLTDVGITEFAGLGRHLPSLELVSDPPAFKRLRMVKTDEEIQRLNEVAGLTEEAITATLDQIAQGVSQAQLARTFHLAVAAKGARLRLDNISLGRSSAFGNANIPGDKVEIGRVIRFDVGAIKGGYISDMARCYSFRQAEDRVLSFYEALHVGQEAALEALRPGVQARDVFEIAVKAVRSAGLPDYQRTHIGHGIGLDGDGYDPPLLAPGDDTILEAGMVLCVETPYYEIGFGGLQVEDMVVVTEEKPTFLTTSRRDFQILA
jgi:Xaa-Pro aminopeptidase